MSHIVNLTAHAVNILDDESSLMMRIEPSGIFARLEQAIEPIGRAGDVPLVRTTFGAPRNLPEPVDGVLLIVPLIIKMSLPERDDLVVPARVIRDGRGLIIGCKALGK